MIQLRPLTVYTYAFWSTEDRALYKDIVETVHKDVSIAGRRRVMEIQLQLRKKGATEDGEKRKQNLMNKLLTGNGQNWSWVCWQS